MITRQVFMVISNYRVQFHARRALVCLFGLLFSVGLMHGAKTRALSQIVQKEATSDGSKRENQSSESYPAASRIPIGSMLPPANMRA